MAPIVGLDLGTTNTCAAHVVSKIPRIIPVESGYNTMPSVVTYHPNGSVYVGQAAKELGATVPQAAIAEVKRLLGRPFDSRMVTELQKRTRYDLVADAQGEAAVRVGGATYEAVDVEARILTQMKRYVEINLGDEVSDAVIAVPAYFNEHQRALVIEAGKRGGWNVVRLVNEPTAAALAYGFGKGLEQRVVIYDFGGGTFDISILEIGQGVFEVLSTAGDTFLGGEDFDERIIDWLRAEFMTDNGLDLRNDKMALQRLRDAAEKAKIELSQAAETDINLPFIASPAGGQALHLQRKLTRDKLLELTGDLIERSITITQKAFESANLKISDVKGVILVGGMTRMPRIQQRVQELFGMAPSKGVHPDEVVACGAAIQGQLLATKSTDTLLLDVTPHNLGIVVAGGLFDTIIPKDTTIPTSEAKLFTTIRDNQTQVRIIVMQGDAGEAKKNELLGEFVLDGLTPAPRGEVQINVTFSISADGIVSVAARDSGTGREQTIQVTASSGLTQNEIADMTAENQDYVQAFAKPTEAANERQELDSLLALIGALMPQVEQVIAGTEFGADAMRKARGAIERANAAIASGERDAMALAKGPLSRALSLFKTVTAKLKRP